MDPSLSSRTRDQEAQDSATRVCENNRMRRIRGSFDRFTALRGRTLEEGQASRNLSITGLLPGCREGRILCSQKKVLESVGLQMSVDKS